MRVRLVRSHFKNHLCIGYFLLPIQRGVIVANKFKCVRTPDALVTWSISAFAYLLAQSAQLVGVRFIPDILVLGIFPQLSVFKLLSRLFINYRHCPVKDKFAQLLSA